MAIHTIGHKPVTDHNGKIIIDPCPCCDCPCENDVDCGFCGDCSPKYFSVSLIGLVPACTGCVNSCTGADESWDFAGITTGAFDATYCLTAQNLLGPGSPCVWLYSGLGNFGGLKKYHGVDCSGVQFAEDRIDIALEKTAAKKWSLTAILRWAISGDGAVLFGTATEDRGSDGCTNDVLLDGFQNDANQPGMCGDCHYGGELLATTAGAAVLGRCC